MRKSEWELLSFLIHELCSLILSFIHLANHLLLFIYSTPGTQRCVGIEGLTRGSLRRCIMFSGCGQREPLHWGCFLSSQRCEQSPGSPAWGGLKGIFLGGRTWAECQRPGRPVEDHQSTQQNWTQNLGFLILGEFFSPVYHHGLLSKDIPG